MKKILLKTIVFAVMLLFVVKSYADESALCPIVPLPQNSSKISDKFELSTKTMISFDKELSEIAHYLQTELLKHLDVTVGLLLPGDIENNNPKIELSMSPNKKKDSKEGSYEIKMNSQKILIVSDSKKGVFNGVISFIQLARLSEQQGEKMSVDCWNIKDAPLYEWRGYMLDEARHFFGIKKVKQILDWMAHYKLNKFHWHLTDSPGWRIEIKKYPLLGSVGGVGSWSDKYVDYWNPNTPTKYYTQEEIKEIVSYASERFIDVIPEIDMPGHASAATRAYPEFSGGGTLPRFPGFTFNPGRDTVYTFLTDILREVDVLFPSQIIHLGGDEVHYGDEGWKTDKYVKELMKKENLENIKEIEKYFFKRIADSLFNFNNKLAAWDEVADSDLPPANTIVYFWRQNRLEQLQKSLDKGYSIVFSPRLPMYLDYAQDTLQVHGVPWNKFGVNSYDKIYNFSKNDFDVKYPKNSKILGIQANLWTERVVTENRLDYMTFPRIAALSETAWTEEKNKNLTNFNERLKKQLILYKKDGVYYHNPFEPRLTGEPIN